ncbi:SatD family protein [Sporolactobacillus sp. STCC-11]|uniref:SatD family protein n=1 Tax=Sporolactobacillus caesalpiniae TaxID=3230362 RepID=UPI003391AA50
MFFFDFKPYIAVIGDLVNSKEIDDRQNVQQKMKTTLNEINTIYDEDLASKFMITLGDEFQGLLQIGNHAFEIIERIERELYPSKVRFGIGVGQITTTIDRDIPLGADGPAYYRARKMIDELKAMEKKKMESKLTMKIDIEGYDDISVLMNTIFSLNAVLKSKWTVRQREIIYAYLKHGRTQVDTAKYLGINQSNVQRALASANFFTYQKVVVNITGILSKIKGEEDV